MISSYCPGDLHPLRFLSQGTRVTGVSQLWMSIICLLYQGNEVRGQGSSYTGQSLLFMGTCELGIPRVNSSPVSSYKKWNDGTNFPNTELTIKCNSKTEAPWLKMVGLWRMPSAEKGGTKGSIWQKYLPHRPVFFSKYLCSRQKCLRGVSLERPWVLPFPTCRHASGRRKRNAITRSPTSLQHSSFREEFWDQWLVKAQRECPLDKAAGWSPAVFKSPEKVWLRREIAHIQAPQHRGRR